VTLYGVEARDPAVVPTGFESWYRHEHPRVVATLSALCWDREAARDAADEAFARALASWERVHSMASPTGWTYRVAFNHLHRTVRRLKMERRLYHRMPATESPSETDHEEIWELLKALPIRQRTAIVLRYLADLPEADIAQAMGVQRGTVASTLSDARRRLAELLRPTLDPEAVTDA
jgi:RNA polymerase sigma-70 factor (ECF subfamily)